jgi:hypothetical protein
MPKNTKVDKCFTKLIDEEKSKASAAAIVTPSQASDQSLVAGLRKDRILDQESLINLFGLTKIEVNGSSGGKARI